jgi:hypothetical protein
MTAAARTSRPGPATVRDFLWLYAGAATLTAIAGDVLLVPSRGTLVQLLVLATAVFVAARYLIPRSGSVLPCPGRPTVTPCPDPAAVTVVRFQAWFLVSVAVIGLALKGLAAPAWGVTVGMWLVIVVGSRVISSRTPALRQLGAAGRLARADLAWVCLGATGLTLHLKVSLPAIFLHALIAGALAERLGPRARPTVVRVAAALAAAGAAYRVLLGLVGIPVLVPLALVAAIAAAVAVTSSVWRRMSARIAVRVAAAFASFVAVLGASFVVALAAAALLMVWGGWVEREINRTGVRNLAMPSARLGLPDTSAPQLQVARSYEPFWVRSHGERWAPIGVDEYLREAELVVGQNEPVEAGVVATERGRELTEGCDTTRRPCVITIGCASADLPCAREPDRSKRTVYARVVERPLEREGLDATRVRGDLRRLQRLVQYWSFYWYDDWSTSLGWLRQWHEADWEWVGVGLGPEGPLFVAFSAHCGGVVRRWSAVSAIADGGRTADGALRLPRPLAAGPHVLAFVARGSHATYPNAWVHTPDWKGCRRNLPVYDVLTWGPTRAVGAREVMRYHEDLRDAIAPPVRVVDESTPFMRFEGYWGAADHFRYFWRGGECPPQDPQAKCHPVPDTPAAKDAWKLPVCTMFCHPYWEAPDACPWPTSTLRRAPCLDP